MFLSLLSLSLSLQKRHSQAITECRMSRNTPATHLSPAKQRNARSGFTLIELSIVLVIIGLVIGGVLVGKDLIAASELRATVSQLEKFRTATTTFKLKYNALPGDMLPANAAQFGLFTITGNCGNSCPFNNGLIGYGGAPDIVYESYVFWAHLTQANLISEGLDSSALQITSGGADEGVLGWQKKTLPSIKYLPNQYWQMELPHQSYRVLPNCVVSYTNENQIGMFGASISPLQAYALDSKIDDGKPNTGKVFDLSGPDAGWQATPTDGYCTHSGVNGCDPETLYNTDAANGGNATAGELCSLKIEAGF